MRRHAPRRTVAALVGSLACVASMTAGASAPDDDLFSAFEEPACLAEPGDDPKPTADLDAGIVLVSDALHEELGSEIAEAVVEPLGETLPAVEGAEAEPTLSEGLATALTTVTLDSAPSSKVREQSSAVKPEFRVKDLAGLQFGSWGFGGEPLSNRRRQPSKCSVAWASPAYYHKPLYFEQPNVERYGHSFALGPHDNLTQSAVSAAHFFATVPVLPYKIGAKPICEPDYTLGAYRPGSCNPSHATKPRFSWRGLAFQGVATTGLVFFVP
ncbi:MAG: hypothetical protein ACRCT8_08795 [Lacipirellulaceae bacterium]